MIHSDDDPARHAPLVQRFPCHAPRRGRGLFSRSSPRCRRSYGHSRPQSLRRQYEAALISAAVDWIDRSGDDTVGGVRLNLAHSYVPKPSPVAEIVDRTIVRTEDQLVDFHQLIVRVEQPELRSMAEILNIVAT